MKRWLSRFASGFALALVPALILSIASANRAQSAPRFDCLQSSAERGGYEVSTAFSVDGARHNVIMLPKCLRAGDLLSIRPLRLNQDEYLVLQECKKAACAQAQVVRAWNSGGYMGPYPVLNDKIPIDDGARYLLWMQHVPLPGNGSFRLIDRYGPPLVFKPIGALTAYGYAQSALRAARGRGPERVTKTAQEGTAFVATFQGGSVVRMQALRPAR
jgi:hypothetical protein